MGRRADRSQSSSSKGCVLIAGIDLSSFAVDIVFLQDDDNYPCWVRAALPLGGDAFDRSRGVVHALWGAFGSKEGVRPPLFGDCAAIGIEEPRGFNPGPAYRVQGAVLQFIPREVLVHPLIPSQWRKAVGLKGNAKKPEIMVFVKDRLGKVAEGWPQDACDAWCLAEATRLALRSGEVHP